MEMTTNCLLVLKVCVMVRGRLKWIDLISSIKEQNYRKGKQTVGENFDIEAIPGGRLAKHRHGIRRHAIEIRVGGTT
jgi:hypothetical protein